MEDNVIICVLPPLADKARVVFTQTVQYIPRGLKGMIRCQTSANPPIKYITWTKDNRLFQPFKTAGIQALLNGSLLIDQVSILLVKYRDEEIYLRIDRRLTSLQLRRRYLYEIPPFADLFSSSNRILLSI